MNPKVILASGLSMQVCVPKRWHNAEVRNFAEKENPCGTTNGWQIRKEGDKLLQGCPERVTCSINRDFVHIMLDA